MRKFAPSKTSCYHVKSLDSLEMMSRAQATPRDVTVDWEGDRVSPEFVRFNWAAYCCGALLSLVSIQKQLKLQ